MCGEGAGQGKSVLRWSGSGCLRGSGSLLQSAPACRERGGSWLDAGREVLAHALRCVGTSEYRGRCIGLFGHWQSYLEVCVLPDTL